MPSLIFGAALYVRDETARTLQWVGVGANALVGGALIGWTIENIPIESLGVGGWARSLMLASVAFLAPVVLTMAIMRKSFVPSFAQLLGPEEQRASEPLGRAAGAILLAVMLLALLIALGLVFDPRYKDFPFAPLTAAILPFVVHGFLDAAGKGTRHCGNVGGLRACAVGGLHRLQRRFRQLAVAVALRGPGGAGRQSGSGARRAKLSSSRPMAREDSPTL